MKVLAVDTTSERESVALADGEVVLAEVRLRTGDVPSRRILPAIAFVLEAAGLAPGEVEGYAVAVGPGSFTGIRVGLSTVQGLALAAGRPCLGVSTLDIVAALAKGEAPTLVPMIDAARSGHVFAALYDGEARAREQPQADAPRRHRRAGQRPRGLPGRRRGAVPCGDPGPASRTPSSRGAASTSPPPWPSSPSRGCVPERGCRPAPCARCTCARRTSGSGP